VAVALAVAMAAIALVTPLGSIGYLAIVAALVMHSLLPPAPYGALEAAGRPDPENGWRVSSTILRSTRIAVALLFVLDGVLTALAATGNLPRYDSTISRAAAAVLGFTSPASIAPLATTSLVTALVEVSIGVMALFVSWRPAIWLVMLAFQIAVIALADCSIFDVGLVALLALGFDPTWIAPVDPANRERANDVVFYDGSCGLCHRAVRFILAEDRRGVFRFAPLGGETFLATIDESRRASLPDSVAIVTAEGELLTRSTAVLRLLDRLGGLWRIFATLGTFIPATVRDALYDGVARIRYNLFAKPSDACPLIPKALRSRFEA